MLVKKNNSTAMAAGVLPLASLRFYADVLGFVPIRRPGSFDFDGAWCVRGRGRLPLPSIFLLSYTTQSSRLFNYGIGVHLLQSEDPGSLPENKGEINPKDNHISFQVRTPSPLSPSHHQTHQQLNITQDTPVTAMAILRYIKSIVDQIANINHFCFQMTS
jgi:catechol 2,3-dioxygenase-like lactoylglutathione lyase family enzyme